MKEKSAQPIMNMHLRGMLDSYAQVFLSNNTLLGVFVFVASFIDPYTGIAGLLAVVFTNTFAHILHYDKVSIEKGYYGYNSLLAGLFVGHSYALNWQVMILLVCMSFLSLMLTVGLSGWLGSKKLPHLSIPFILLVWLLQLSIPSFNAIGNSDRTIFIYNELMRVGGTPLTELYDQIQAIQMPKLMDVFLRSLGAILFQYNIISGFLVAIGILIFSRIAFMLSVLGFMCGYGFYTLLDGNMNQLYYSFIGFNFILTAIAIGGFYLIANTYSFLFVILITPLIALTIAANGTMLEPFHLAILSLPFNFIVILSLYFLYFRTHADKLKLTTLQLFSPEKNLYAHQHQQERYKNQHYLPIRLPFFGEWLVSQGHDGQITHKAEWKDAWDFVIEDDYNRTYRLPGNKLEDFYCYNLPVLAPASGYIEEVIDGIPENEIGDNNLQQNWGNTIIIRHTPLLFSKLSHLKTGSVKVKTGEYVFAGQPIAHNGSSGRSPEPHLHYQLQSTPFIGSATLSYPISYFVSRNNREFTFHSFEIPQENQHIQHIQLNKLLLDAFHFIPGSKIKWDLQNGSFEDWEVYTDAYNQSYFYCALTKSTAWFVNNGTLFYCTAFHGDKKSLLYAFYLACQKIVLGYYHQMKLQETCSIDELSLKSMRVIQDVVAPFHLFMRTEYESMFASIDNELYPGHIEVQSTVKAIAFNNVLTEWNFTIEFNGNGIHSLKVSNPNGLLEAVCLR